MQEHKLEQLRKGSPIYLESIKDWTREEWEKDRQARKTNGGSDAGTILGFNKYSSPYELWAQKTGKVIPEDISSKEAVRLGNDLEQYVADRFMEDSGKKVRRDNHIWTNTNYPFAHANIDRIVVGENAILECKTTSSWEVLEQCRKGEYPASWLCQVTHYMMVGEFEKAYLAVLVFGQGFYWFEIPRIEENIKALASVEEEFYQKVMTNTAPAVDGSEATTETLRTIFSEDNGTNCDLTMYGTELETLVKLKAQQKDLKEKIDEIQNTIMEFMGNSATGSYRNIKVTWKNTSRRSFDKKAYESVMGTIPDQFYTTSASRTFTVKEGKK